MKESKKERRAKDEEENGQGGKRGGGALAPHTEQLITLVPISKHKQTKIMHALEMLIKTNIKNLPKLRQNPGFVHFCSVFYDIRPEHKSRKRLQQD